MVRYVLQRHMSRNMGSPQRPRSMFRGSGAFSYASGVRSSRCSWSLPAAALFPSGSTGLRALFMEPQIEPCGSLTDSTEGIVTGAAGCVVEADASLLRVPSSARSARSAM